MDHTTDGAHRAKPVVVAVLDTGIYEDHPKLKDKMLQGSINFVSGGRSLFLLRLVVLVSWREGSCGLLFINNLMQRKKCMTFFFFEME